MLPRSLIQLEVGETPVSKHAFHMYLKHGLVNNALSLLELLSLVRVLKYREDIETVVSDFKELEVRVDLILGLLPQDHLLFLTLTKRREGISIIEVCFVPEHSEE